MEEAGDLDSRTHRELKAPDCSSLEVEEVVGEVEADC